MRAQKRIKEKSHPTQLGWLLTEDQGNGNRRKLAFYRAE
jgi:hypothetical protein